MARAVMLLALLLLVTGPAYGQTVVAEIWEIQGAGHLSLLDELPVITQNNIVTAVDSRGFYMQTPTHLFPARDDGNLATSNGLYVFTFDEPAVRAGDLVDVRGQVTEFRPGANNDEPTDNLTITEITQATIRVVSHGNPLPPPVVIGAGGRIPPGLVIDDDSTGNVETSGTFDAGADAIDFYESLEGMRVQVNEAVVVGPAGSGGSLWVVGDNGLNARPLTPRNGIVVAPRDFNPERIQLDDRLYPGEWPELGVGGRFTAPVIGVVTYSLGRFDNNYGVLVTELTRAVPSALEAEETDLFGVGAQLTVATYNVENLGGNQLNSTFDPRGAQIAFNLAAPDLVALQEMQDNTGRRQDDVVAADVTFEKLIAAIERAGGPTYAYTQINPRDDEEGGQPGGNIRVGFLYNPDRLTLVERPAGEATTANRVICDAGEATLELNPGRIDPENVAFANSRRMLAAEFLFGDERLIVINVHFNSKGGDDALFGFRQPPLFESEVQRLGQATVINSFVAEILACQPDANVIVLGDMNDFDFSLPVQALAGDELTNLATLLPANQRYSYIYQGNSQLFDQILVSRSLMNDHDPAFDLVHINAEFPEDQQVTDHDPAIARFDFGP